jgi:DNA-binding HxlR family transcriptional regulator
MKKRYLQYCGLARALDLIGERWTLLAVRELLTGPKRFSQLMNGLAGISPNLLTVRLKAMEAEGLLEKKDRRYQLTEFGWGLEAVVFSMAQWGSQTMVGGPTPDESMNVGWMLLSLTRAYRGGLRGVLGVSVGGRDFELSLRQERMFVTERQAVAPDVRVVAPDFMAAASVFKKGEPWQGKLQVSGDEELFGNFLEALSC